MLELRKTAIENAIKADGERKINHYKDKRITSIFNTNVFTERVMREYLSDEAYKSLLNSRSKGIKIERRVADQVASGMKAWAEDKGVTHYTHWFQPLTGTTAEKHDSFFTIKPDGTPIELFDGDTLIQQEPDASSFPNGGIRATFEARGYSAWDPSSPAFIIESGFGKTLCIPTIFIAYNGESLDYKAPLLKSISSLEKAALDVCHYFDKNIQKITITLGWEQEYFLIDESIANARPDILMCGRTLLGHSPAKGQQLEDHYFGSIPDRVFAFMQDYEQEAYKLGIPLRTRHNEVAPSQFECAPIYEEMNIAVDHNTLLMDIMSKVAKRHKLRVLFHEKPFKGVNGSGKHNNWSLATDTGINLLAPGKTPRTNVMFLVFFVNTIKAVHDNADLLRAIISSAGNDHRLGANEAPPAIMSVYLGKYLSQILDEVEARVGTSFNEQDEQMLKLDIHKYLPEVLMDNTDRNRTSPFAFTGNKFEFRAVGSSTNCASPMTVLNTMVAQSLKQFKIDVDLLIEKGEKKELALMQVLRDYIKDSKKIRFEGDNYSENWANEAAKRGLSNLKTTPEALEAIVSESSKRLFIENDIFTEREIEARYEIMLEDYVKKVQIEARILGNMATNHILPAAIKYQNILIENVKSLKDIGIDPSSCAAQMNIINYMSKHIQNLSQNVEAMIAERKKANKVEETHKRATMYCNNVKILFDKIRRAADKLELLVDNELYPLPTYHEMLHLG